MTYQYYEKQYVESKKEVLTREEKENRKLELLDDMLFGEKNDSKR